MKSSDLVTDLAQRSADLSGLVEHLATTTQAFAAQQTALGESIQRLPGFMRLANTTFVNLRTALDALTPLVNASKPVAPKLEALLVQLRPLAEESVPTVRELADVVKRPGPNNDLIDLTDLGVPLAAVTVHPVRANGKVRPGAFPQTTVALNDFTPELAVGAAVLGRSDRLVRGFLAPRDDRRERRREPRGGHAERALGQRQRPAGFAAPAAAADRGGAVTHRARRGLTAFQGDRCPGSIERGGLFFPESGFPCNPSEVPTGP